MARYLVHVLGDIHQPLHASSFFDNDKFKNGDQGGNLFKINFKAGIENLHKLFDSGIGNLGQRITRPLNKESQEYLIQTAKQIIAEFPQSSLPELKRTDFSDWVEESRDISQDFIYKGITYDGTPSDEYTQTAYKIVRKRIALGGYRLANVFKQLKQSYNKLDEFLK